VNRATVGSRSSLDRKVFLRVVCLGNESVADDSFGPAVAQELRDLALENVEIVESPGTGLDLLDYALNVHHLALIDTIRTGTVPVGEVRQFHDGDLHAVPGGSPHYMGPFEAFKVARELSLPVADDVVILAVEAEDCLTFGKEMCLAVRSAIPEVIRTLQAMVPTPATRAQLS